jgi:hypothetical protein
MYLPVLLLRIPGALHAVPFLVLAPHCGAFDGSHRDYLQQAARVPVVDHVVALGGARSATSKLFIFARRNDRGAWGPSEFGPRKVSKSEHLNLLEETPLANEPLVQAACRPPPVACDPLFSREFLGLLEGIGVASVPLPPRSPNLNAYAERFVRSIKESCLDRMIWFGEAALRKGIQEFVLHYHHERHHQGIGNRLILPERAHADASGTVLRRERLGGMLNYYYRAA